MKRLIVAVLSLFFVLSPVVAVDMHHNMLTGDKDYEVNGDGDISSNTYGFKIHEIYPSGNFEYSFFKRDGIPVKHHVTLKRGITLTYYTNNAIGFAPGQPTWYDEYRFAGVGLEPGQSHNEGTLDYSKGRALLDHYSTNPDGYYIE